MNKKFTMLVAALLAGGSFSAMAEEFKLADEATIKKDAKIYLVAEDGVKDHSAGDVAMGVTLSDKTLAAASASAVEKDGAYTGTYESGQADVTNFFWTVKEEKSEGTTYFTFTNAKTGKYLTFSGSNLVTNADNASAAGGVIYFDMAEAANGLLKTKDGQYVKFADGKLTLVDEANKAEATTFAAYTVAEKELEADELNAVMGGDGFSLSPVGTTVADENNVFSQQIKAIKFGHAENEVTKEEILPGLYFVVDAPEELTKLLNSKDQIYASAFEGDTRDEQVKAYIDAFNACTFVAVSPSESYQTSEVEKNGLKLITISGNELIKEPQTNSQYATTGDQVYIGNAVFTVKALDQYAKPGEYQLTLNQARYKESGKNSQANVSASNPLKIGVTTILGVNYVTTTENATSFKISTSSLVKGISLLKTTKDASVYTIKFVSGEDEENSEYGKYLGSAVVTSSYEMVAQGDALVDTNLPQYQFAVYNVDVNTQEVTFINIETQEPFTTQLFATGVDNQYKLIGATANVAIAEEDEQQKIYYSSPESMSGMIVELAPVTVDLYAGFFQKGIDNNEPYRLAFAANATTNNKWYVAVNANDDAKTAISETRSLQVVFEPVLKTSDNKTIDEESITTTFAYNNNGKVYKASADLVNYYTYKMRVVDAEDAYLSWSGNNVTIVSNENAATEVIVKYRYDGSVALTKASSLNDATVALSAKLNTEKSGYVYTTTKAYAVPDLDAVNLYLEAEQLGVSLPASEGHYTFEAENGGFVSANEANEGVIAIRTEAGEDLTFWVDTTASEKVIPSFYIAKGGKYLYHSQDSLDVYDKTHTSAKANPYEIFMDDNSYAKAIFKAGELVNSDTLKTTVDNKEVLVAEKADQNKGILGGLNNFQFQIVKPSDAEDNYVIRVNSINKYLSNFNGVLGFISDKDNAMRVIVEGQAAPTANESVSATEVKVVAYDGAINIKNAAGKNVVISTILGQIVANEVLTSDNATISVPAGIAIVSVDGEEAVKVSVR